VLIREGESTFFLTSYPKTLLKQTNNHHQIIHVYVFGTEKTVDKVMMVTAQTNKGSTVHQFQKFIPLDTHQILMVFAENVMTYQHGLPTAHRTPVADFLFDYFMSFFVHPVPPRKPLTD
jgi:hypothetical protein